MWQEYNPNPCGRAVGDCAVRAIAKALGDIDWETAYVMIASNGFAMCDMPSSNSVWSSLLRERGYKRINVDEPMTFGEYADTHKDGIAVLCSGTHVATVISGILYDAWDSSREHIDFIWRKDD